MSNIEQTLSIIKPDAVERNLTDIIKKIFEKNNLNIKDSKKIMPNSLNITSLNDLVKENVNDNLSTKKLSEVEIENKLKQK